MRYVFPVPRKLRGVLLAHCRLYAFPVEPEPPPDDGFVILDSGAFALSRRGASITTIHMRRLAAHYARWEGERIWCCAPDVYLEPAQTMLNWRFWRGQGYPTVFPVVQFSRARSLDLYVVHRQLCLYASSRPAFIGVSNPALRGVEARQAGMRRVFDMIRAVLPCVWIHVLGAGWDLGDIRDWAGIGGFDSMDSIAYYTAAQGGESWRTCGGTWVETAVFNACAARETLDNAETTK